MQTVITMINIKNILLFILWAFVLILKAQGNSDVKSYGEENIKMYCQIIKSYTEFNGRKDYKYHIPICNNMACDPDKYYLSKNSLDTGYVKVFKRLDEEFPIIKMKNLYICLLKGGERCNTSTACHSKQCINKRCLCQLGDRTDACKKFNEMKCMSVIDCWYIPRGQCLGNTCGCRNGTYFKDSSCFPKKRLSESCKENAECLKERCSVNTQKCICGKEKYQVKQKCVDLKQKGAKCRENGECITKFCSEQICSCKSNQYEYNGSCLVKKDFGQICFNHNECRSQFCYHNACYCSKNEYRSERKECKLLKKLGESCIAGRECRKKTCENDKCTCPTNMYRVKNECFEKVEILQIHEGREEEKKTNGKVCRSDKSVSSFCWKSLSKRGKKDGICKCVEGFNSNRKYKKFKRFHRTCKRNQDCERRQVCRSKVCQCRPGYEYKERGCRPKKKYACFSSYIIEIRVPKGVESELAKQQPTNKLRIRIEDEIERIFKKSLGKYIDNRVNLERHKIIIEVFTTEYTFRVQERIKKLLLKNFKVLDEDSKKNILRLKKSKIKISKRKQCSYVKFFIPHFTIIALLLFWVWYFFRFFK